MLNDELNGQRSASPSNTTDDVKQEADNLARDLIKIIDSNTDGYEIIANTKWANVDIVDLIQDLCIYIVERDQKVWQAGHNVGAKNRGT